MGALKRSKAAADATEAVEKVVDGAAFRDALLVSLGTEQVTAAQLQSFFVTHRKCNAAEALADVGSIVQAIHQKKRERAAQGTTVDVADKSAAERSASGKAEVKQPVAAKGQDERVVHVHVHTSDGHS